MIPQTFNGYRCPDGRVGIRNHVLILPTSICASDICEHIARAVDGCISFIIKMDVPRLITIVMSQ